MNLEPASNAKDAEKLLMSFDTMNFTIPSPTSASSKKRGGFFGKKEPGGNVAGAKTSGGAAAGSAMGECAGRALAASSHGGPMSPSLKGTVAAASATAAELRKEQARMPTANGLTSSLSITAPADPFLGVLNVATTTPTASEQAERKIGSYSPQARKLRIQKFHEKRKNRTWKKSIKYDCRKKLADDRPRIKGRFVRVLENAGDATDDGAASPTASGGASPLGSTPAGYASPTSPTGAMAPPVMALPTAPVKRSPVVHQDSMALASSLAKPMVSKAVSSYGSAPTSELQRTSPALVPAPTQVPVPASASARGAIARMIASV
ncbi:hypothetical protein BBJ28_00000317 [Nothophytophthora sp. Chile5]|nr:hypothetical protein BBJ28_00000317 [Nothophytophthora sp. Chile5]